MSFEVIETTAALSNVETTVATLTVYHPFVSVYVDGAGLAAANGSIWRLYAVSDGASVLISTGRLTTQGAPTALLLGVDTMGALIKLTVQGTNGVSGNVTSELVGYDPGDVLTPATAYVNANVMLNYTEQDVATLSQNYPLLNVSVKPNSDPLAKGSLWRIYALFGSTRYLIGEAQITDTKNPALLFPNLSGSGTEYVLTAQGVLGVSGVNVTGVIFGSNPVTQSGGGGGGGGLPSGLPGEDLICTGGTTYVPVPVNHGPYTTVADWYIDPVHGSDTNDGLTAGTALQHWQPPGFLQRVPLGSTIGQNTTFHFLSDAPDTSDSIDIDYNLEEGITLLLRGTTTILKSGSITALQILDRTGPSGGSPWLVTDGAATFTNSDIGNLIHDTTANAYAVIASVISPTQIRTGQWFAPLTPGSTAIPVLAPPTNGDTYTILDQTHIAMGFATLSSDGGAGAPSLVCYYHLHAVDGSGQTNVTQYQTFSRNDTPGCLLQECQWEGIHAFDQLSLYNTAIEFFSTTEFSLILGGACTTKDSVSRSALYIISCNEVAVIDGDFILDQGGYIQPSYGITLIGSIWCYGPYGFLISGPATIDFSSNFGYPNTPYMAGKPAGDYLLFGGVIGGGTNSAAIFYNGDPATVFYGEGTPDITFPGNALASGIDPTTGQPVLWQSPTFAALKTSVASGGFGGTIIDLISGNRIVKTDTAGFATVTAGLYGDGAGNIVVDKPFILKGGKVEVTPETGALLQNDQPPTTTTVNATPVTAYSFAMPDHTLLKMDVLVLAVDTTTGASWATFNLSASYLRNGGAPNAGGSTTTSADPKGSNSGAPPTGWDATITTATNAIIVQVTGDSSDSVKWFVLPQTQTLTS